MSHELRFNRKLDFMLTVGAILLLWGPGVGLPLGDRPTLAPPAQAALVAPERPYRPCQDGHAALPVAAARGLDRYAAFQVTVTGYSSSVHETDETPGLTAANTEAREGVIALSQDLLREFTPGAPFSFHDRVEIPGLGQFRVEDTMSPRWNLRADVWFADRDDALSWGRRNKRLYRLPQNAAESLPMPGPREVAAAFGQANFQ